MRKTILVAVATALVLAACGAGGPQSGGPLTTPTSAPGPDATTTSTTTTLPAPPTTSGGPATPTTSPEPTVAGRTITIYLLDGQGRAVPTTRDVATEGVARAAVTALIAGPTAREAVAGLSTAFPPDSLLLGIDIAGGTAIVDMSREFESGGGSSSVLGRLAQLVYTLTEFDSVERVELRLDGEEIDYFSGEGVVAGDGWTRADFAGSNPLGEPLDGSGATTWSQSDLPPVDPASESARTVVLVAADDYLNVRVPAGVEGTVIGRLLPGALVRATGSVSDVGGSAWAEIETPGGRGWVNGLYLTPSSGALPSGSETRALVDELVARLASGGDFSELVSAKGLWISHHDDPIRFRRDELAGILSDPTTYRWGSNALEPGSPEIEPRTFAEAIAAPVVDVYEDPDLEVAVNDVIEGPNGRPAEFALPVEFRGFPFLTLFDPGDDPQYEGLDWMSWIVSFSPEEGELRVVGLTIDQWAP